MRLVRLPPLTATNQEAWPGHTGSAYVPEPNRSLGAAPACLGFPHANDSHILPTEYILPLWYGLPRRFPSALFLSIKWLTLSLTKRPLHKDRFKWRYCLLIRLSNKGFRDRALLLGYRFCPSS